MPRGHLPQNCSFFPTLLQILISGQVPELLLLLVCVCVCVCVCPIDQGAPEGSYREEPGALSANTYAKRVRIDTSLEQKGSTLSHTCTHLPPPHHHLPVLHNYASSARMCTSSLSKKSSALPQHTCTRLPLPHAPSAGAAAACPAPLSALTLPSLLHQHA